MAKGQAGRARQVVGLTVGYPLLLSAIYRSDGCRLDRVRFVQLLAGLGVVALTVLLAWLLFGPVEALLAGLLLALYAPFMFYETKLVPAVWAALVSMLALVALEYARRGSVVMAWAAGLCLGLGVAMRPNLLLLPLFVLSLWALLAWRQGRALRSERFGQVWPRLLAALLGLGIALVPAAMFLEMATGHWHLFPATGGATFMAGNHANAKGVYEPPAGFKGDKAGQMAQSVRLARQTGGTGTEGADPYRVSHVLVRSTLQWMWSHPWQVARLVLLKAYRFMLASEPRSAYSVRAERRRVGALNLGFVPWSLLAVFALIGIWVGRGRMELVPVMALMAVAWVTSLVFFVSSRYRVVAAPAAAVLAASASSWLVTRRGRSGVLVAVLAVAAVGAFFWDPFLDARRLDAVDLFNRAVAHRRLGERVEALGLFVKAADIGGGAAVFQVEVANTLLEMGRTSEAYAMYERITKDHPGNVDAWTNLAILDWRAGRFERASTHLRRALALRPEDPLLLINLARLAMKQGKDSEARKILESIHLQAASGAIRNRVRILLGILDRRKPYPEPRPNGHGGRLPTK